MNKFESIIPQTIEKFLSSEQLHKLNEEIERAKKYRPPYLHGAVARIFFDTLRHQFGKDVVTGCSIVGSVATGKAKEGSDIDGAIYVSERERVNEIKIFQSVLQDYVLGKIGYNMINGCDFAANILSGKEAYSHLNAGGTEESKNKRIIW